MEIRSAKDWFTARIEQIKGKLSRMKYECEYNRNDGSTV